MAYNRQNGPRNNSGSNMGDTVTLSVTGLRQSKAASNDDGGVHSLKVFLEKKASRPISKSYIHGDDFIISVRAADEHRFLHLNNYQWAGTNITVTKFSQQQSNRSQPQSAPRNITQSNSNNYNAPTGPRQQRQSGRLDNQNQRPDGADNVMRDSPFGQSNNARRRNQQQGNASDLTEVIASVVRNRYNATEKYLTLESLAMEPQFQQAGLSSQSASKVFSAVFVTCENQVFETPAKRKEMVESLSLSNNSLTTAKDVIAAASTFSHIKNLDLSNNNIADVGELRFWRNRFRNLEHLILNGNPVALKPDTKDIMKRWYTNLKFYNGAPIGSDPASLSAIPNHLQQPSPPLPTASPVNPLPTEPHPEFPPDSTFGVPTPDKPEDVLAKEQMGLQFSFQTHLKMQWVEECLSANNFNYNAALADLQQNVDAGKVPADAFLQV